MKIRTAKKCLEIIAKIVATQNIGGLSYVEEAISQDIEKNEMRSRLTKECIKVHNHLKETNKKQK